MGSIPNINSKVINKFIRLGMIDDDLDEVKFPKVLHSCGKVSIICEVSDKAMASIIVQIASPTIRMYFVLIPEEK